MKKVIATREASNTFDDPMNRRVMIIAGALGFVLAGFLVRRAAVPTESLRTSPPNVAHAGDAVAENKGAAGVQSEEGTGNDPAGQVEEPDVILAPPLELGTAKLAWELRLEEVIDSVELTEVHKARRLLAMIPSLPEEALDTAAQEAVARLPDGDYAAAAGVLLNPNTHGTVFSVLFADLMERPDAITLPNLLAIARIPTHPYAPYALDNLDLLTGENHNADWLAWTKAVERTLRKSASAQPPSVPEL